MNAKKIMGAVLVALLAAALFVGAGSAAVADGDTVFLYQNLTDSKDVLKGTWSNGDSSISLSEIKGQSYFVPTENFKAGTYTNGTDGWSITIDYPTATISGLAKDGTEEYIVSNGGTLYQGDEFAISNSSAPVELAGFLVTSPDQTQEVLSATEAAAKVNNTKTGQFKIQAYFKADGFVNGTPVDLLAGKEVYIVNVVKSDDVTVSASVESVLKNKVFALTITGKPGETYKMDYGSYFKFDSNGTSTTGANGSTVTIANTGKATIYVEAIKKGEGKIVVRDLTDDEEKASVTITVTTGTVTAEADKESYYLGNKVTLSGTSTAATTLFTYIQGTNIDFQPLVMGIDVDNDKWEEELTADELKVKKDGQSGKKTLDAGTYTIYVATNNISEATTAEKQIMKVDNLDTYAAVSVVMKQPFISITDAPAVAVKDSDYKVTGTAEATTELAVYLFGTNFFAASNGTQVVAGSLFSSEPVNFDGNEFTIEFKVIDAMAAGQYFMVIQHPMYDGNFNIAAANQTGDILLNNTGDAIAGYGQNKVLFNVYERQTANAAQALCDALETQDIDDMYVKLSFVVAAPTSTINPIPAEVTQGSKLTISGQTNLGAGKTVTVEMLSTAFAAVPKDTVGSAAFATVMTKTDADGNWEVTIDTTDMNVDEYTVSVAVGTLDKTTAKVNIIEGAPTEQPTENPTEQPTQTEQPTEAPATPGFGALAALAGLGAVAVLLLRRE